MLLFNKTPLSAFGLLFVLTACGGGGGSDSTPDETVQAPIFSTFQAADVVIGQPDFEGIGRNQGGTAAANTFNGPYGNAGVANGMLYLGDYANNRLLGFNTIPTANNTTADFVLGQPDTTTSTNGTSATKFSGIENPAFDNGKMFLTSYGNSRILIWNSIPSSGGEPADVVLGAPDLDTAGSGSCNSTDLNGPEGMWAVDGKLIVSDSNNNRVLIWDTIPILDNTPADIVLGQQDFIHCAGNDTDNDGVADVTSAKTLNYPAGVWSDGTRLVVLDDSNHRALIWNTFPTSNFTAADVVLGQGDFIHNVPNDDDQDGIEDAASSARTLNDPYVGVYSNGTQLFIADWTNNRVLVWNTFPTNNFAAADVVLGQGDFTHSARNDDDQDGNVVTAPSASARTLNNPTGVYQVGNQLIVTDEKNHRYLIYNGS